MTTLHQLTDNCLAVAGLPNDANSFSSFHAKLLHYSKEYISEDNKFGYDLLQLPSGNWRIIGKANELKEHDWDRIVDGFSAGSLGVFYKNYLTDKENQYSLKYATESGASLLKLHKLENPLILIKG